MNDKLIFLAKSYNLVVGDKFELFYRGVLKVINPYNFYIKIECLKGTPYPRYYTFTPKVEDVGEYELKLSLVNDYGETIEEGYTKLIVVNPERPDKKTNILCIGDSLTASGAWTMEGYRRFTRNDGGTDLKPLGLGYNDTINLIGLCKKKLDDEEIGFEGYGSWQWKTFCTEGLASKTSSLWVETNHDKDENDQHSLWMNNNTLWILETIEEKRLKFKRGPNHTEIDPVLTDTFTNVSGGVHLGDIVVTSKEYEAGNPFWNKEKNDIDLAEYIRKNDFEIPDYVYILLTWNGLYQPYKKDFPIHLEYATHLLDEIHKAFPNCKIRCLGNELSSVTGGIPANYGAHGPYSDMYGTLSTAFYYNEWLESLCLSDKYKDYVEYLDVKGQFDLENNMPYVELNVNSRNPLKEKVGSNGVHPTLNGYMQIGDVFYRSLVKELCKK